MLTPLFSNNSLAVPKILFRSSRYSNLSSTAKMVYSLLLECLTFAQNRNWVDENGDFYLLLPQQAIAQSLGIRRMSVNRAMKELIEYELVEVKQQGLCLPNRIYVFEPVIRQEEMNKDNCQALLLG